MLRNAVICLDFRQRFSLKTHIKIRLHDVEFVLIFTNYTMKASVQLSGIPTQPKQFRPHKTKKKNLNMAYTV